MRKFKRGLGMVLIVLGAYFVFLTILLPFFSSSDDSNGVQIGISFLIAASILLGLGWLLRRSAGHKGKSTTQSSAPGAVEAPATEAPAVAEPAPALPARAVPGESAQEGGGLVFWTVISPFLALPFHEGDRFFLFQSEQGARDFIQALGQPGMTVRQLQGDFLCREMAEYLCCGYTGAILKRDCSVPKRTDQDETLDGDALRERFQVPALDRFGHILPQVVKRVHNYLNQLDYTRRRHTDGNPEFWVRHLRDYKADVIRRLLDSPLCLPSVKGEDGNLRFSMPMAQLPDGRKFASVFTDQFAIDRYMGPGKGSIVFPGLLSDVAKQLREGRLEGAVGIMINPGREELKLTAEEIAEQEARL